MGKGRHIDIMGIVNITDDSYFAESRCADVPAVISRVSRMMEEGVDIIDIGACSTRPGSLPVGAEQEWRRLEPVLEAVKEKFPHARLSIDTYWSSVVSRAYDLIGDFIVNDISAGAADEGMLPVTGALGLTYVAMHMRGTPENMQSLTDYADVTEDVVRYFCDFSVKAADNGIKDWILDPGFGFAKNIQQNYTLLNELNRLRQVSRADGLTPKILVGVSRKSMIYKLLGISPEDSLPATQVLHFAAMQNGADILRVHDVAEAVRTRDLYNMVALSQFAK